MKNQNLPAILGSIAIVVVAVCAVAYFGIWIWIPRDVADEVLIAFGQDAGVPEKHILPKDYQGWVIVKYGVPGKPPLRMVDGVLVHLHSGAEILETSTKWSPGIKRKEYFCDVETGLVALARDGANRRIWGEQDISMGDEDDASEMVRYSAFFVGTRAQYGKAPQLPILMFGVPVQRNQTPGLLR